MTMTPQVVQVHCETTVIVYDPDAAELSEPKAEDVAREELARRHGIDATGTYVTTERVWPNRVIVTFEH